MVEDYLVTTLEGANLACMHRNQCTLAPQDICLYRRIKGEDEKIGETLRSQEARKRDWAKYKEGHLTPAEGHSTGHGAKEEAEGHVNQEETESSAAPQELGPHQ